MWGLQLELHWPGTLSCGGGRSGAQKAPSNAITCALATRKMMLSWTVAMAISAWTAAAGCRGFGQRRSSARHRADLAAAVRVADACPSFPFLWPTVSARDCPAKVQPLYELEAMLTESSKHIQAMTAVDPLNARERLRWPPKWWADGPNCASSCHL
ncbi:MAG: hypothetical protein U0401_18235 [Anaerolineae bacterium]